MTWRLLFLLALLLPELPVDPFQAELPASISHPLGTDALGRDGLLRLLLAGGRSLGFASAVAATSLGIAIALAMFEPRYREARSAFRSAPPLLFLLPLGAAFGGLDWLGLGGLLSILLALHLEAPLALRIEPVFHGPAADMDRVLGFSPLHRIRIWAPWAADQAAVLFPSAWIGALWSEATLRLLGLGPGPQHDSLGLLLNEELPKLGTDPSALGIAALGVVLGLAGSLGYRENDKGENC